MPLVDAVAELDACAGGSCSHPANDPDRVDVLERRIVEPLGEVAAPAAMSNMLQASAMGAVAHSRPWVQTARVVAPGASVGARSLRR